MEVKPGYARYMEPNRELDRITPYEEGGDVHKRIDEVVMMEPDSVHLEMMSDTSCWLRIGTNIFDLTVQKGELVISFREDQGSDMPERT